MFILFYHSPHLLNAVQAAELRRLNAERAQQQMDVSRVEAEDKEVLQRNTSLNKQQAALQAEVRNLKLASNQASDQASQAKFDLSALQQEGDQLRDQVVQVRTHFLVTAKGIGSFSSA